MGVRWFDFSLLPGSSNILLYIIISAVWPTSIGIITQFCLSIYKGSNTSSFCGHYVIKLLFTFASILSYIALPSTIRVCAIAFNQEENNLKSIAGLTLILYLIPIYFITNFVTIEVSWHSKRIESLFSYPNALMLFNLIRLIAAVIIIPHNIQALQ